MSYLGRGYYQWKPEDTKKVLAEFKVYIEYSSQQGSKGKLPGKHTILTTTLIIVETSLDLSLHNYVHLAKICNLIQEWATLFNSNIIYILDGISYKSA